MHVQSNIHFVSDKNAIKKYGLLIKFVQCLFY